MGVCKTLAILVALLPATAVGHDVNIIPFVTAGVTVEPGYYPALVREMRAIASGSAGANCPDVTIRLGQPQEIPRSYSQSGSVMLEREKERLLDYVGLNHGNTLFVKELSTCGLGYEGYSGVVGCAGRNGKVTVEITGKISRAKYDAAALVHEIGHSLGLAEDSPASEARHRDNDGGIDKAHLADGGRLMYYSVVENAVMSNHDCQEFVASNALFRPALSSAVVEMAAGDVVSDDPVDVVVEALTLRKLLSQIWLHEPPLLDLKKAIQVEGLDFVRTVVVTDTYPDLWHNALLTLGYLGEKSDAGLVRHFLGRELPVPEGDEILVRKAKTAAAQAVGILTGRFLDSTESASIAFDIMSEAYMSVASSENVGSELLPLEGLNLNGLSESERLFTREVVLKTLAITQEVAIAKLDHNALASLSVNDNYVAAVAPLDEDWTEKVVTRSNMLSQIGLDDSFVEALSEYRDELSNSE